MLSHNNSNHANYFTWTQFLSMFFFHVIYIWFGFGFCTMFVTNELIWNLVFLCYTMNVVVFLVFFLFMFVSICLYFLSFTQSLVQCRLCSSHFLSHTSNSLDFWFCYGCHLCCVLCFCVCMCVCVLSFNTIENKLNLCIIIIFIFFVNVSTWLIFFRIEFH